MSGESETHSFEESSREVTAVWDRIAGWWDGFLGDGGNQTHRELVGPAQERLLGLRQDDLVLEVACGNGILARTMAGTGARVVALDASPTFIERARARTTDNADRIEYRVMDATDGAQLMTLGERRFDAAVCAMALMDMPAIRPLATALGRLLKTGGRFVFTVMHPCFNSESAKRVVEEEERDGRLVVERYVKVSGYITPKHALGIGIPGQPEPHHYFDRPISLLFNEFFSAGFVLDGIEEPVPEEDDGYKEIPSVLVARMRLLPPGG